MLIEINGGKNGIAEYLKTGQKKDRSLTRDELDKRLVLNGDLELTDKIIKSLNYKENYHHITLSFKEDFVSEEDLQKASDEFEKFIKAAYKDEEINFYCEAHIPKIKSYKAKNGELVIRKPHIHIVIPNQNLLTGKKLQPLGYVKNNTYFVDAFQELFNQRYGFESPKDNLRNEFNLESTIIAREKCDLFTRNISEKEEILNYVIENRINSYDKFQVYLKTQGTVKPRNEGKDNEYLNLKFTHHSQGMNLKEFCFSQEFIEEYSYEDKLNFLQSKLEEKYIDKKESYKSKKTEKYKKLFKDWFDFRALENKYVTSSKFYKEIYKDYSKEEKIEHLNQKHKEFYKKNDLKKDIEDYIKDIKEDEIFNIKETKNELTKQRALEINSLDKEYRSKFQEKLQKEKILGTKNLNTLENIGDIKNGINRENSFKTKAKQTARLQESYYRLNRNYIAATKRDGLPKLSVSQLVYNRNDINQLLQSNVYNHMENKRGSRGNSILRFKRDSNSSIKRRKINLTSSNYISSKLKNELSKKELEHLQIKDELISKFYDNLIQTKGVLKNKYGLDEKGIYLNANPIKYITTKEFLGEELNMLAGEIKLLEDSIQRIEHDYNKNIILSKGKKIMAIKINIKTNVKDKTKVDYYQLGQQDVAGRFTGVIHDKASEYDTALAYAINGKVVGLEEFKKQQPDMYKEIEDKTKSLFNINETDRYNERFRAIVKNREISLTKEGFGHANSQYNFNNGLDVVQMGITEFDNAKKLDKNFFQIAKDFVTAKDFRDNIKVKMHDFKEKIASFMTSKPELAASNIALAAQLQEMKVRLASIQTFQEALKKNQELSNEIENAKQMDKTQNQEDKKEFSFKEIFKEVKELGSKIDNAKDIAEIANNPDFKDKRDTAIELLTNLKEHPELIENINCDNLKLSEAKAVNLAVRNNIPLQGKEKLKDFMQIVKNVANVSIEQSLDFNTTLAKTLGKMSEKFLTKEQIQEQSQQKGQEQGI